MCPGGCNVPWWLQRALAAAHAPSTRDAARPCHLVRMVSIQTCLVDPARAATVLYSLTLAAVQTLSM